MTFAQINPNSPPPLPQNFQWNNGQPTYNPGGVLGSGNGANFYQAQQSLPPRRMPGNLPFGTGYRPPQRSWNWHPAPSPNPAPMTGQGMPTAPPPQQAGQSPFQVPAFPQSSLGNYFTPHQPGQAQTVPNPTPAPNFIGSQAAPAQTRDSIGNQPNALGDPTYDSSRPFSLDMNGNMFQAGANGNQQFVNSQGGPSLQPGQSPTGTRPFIPAWMQLGLSGPPQGPGVQPQGSNGYSYSLPGYQNKPPPYTPSNYMAKQRQINAGMLPTTGPNAAANAASNRANAPWLFGGYAGGAPRAIQAYYDSLQNPGPSSQSGYLPPMSGFRRPDPGSPTSVNGAPINY